MLTNKDFARAARVIVIQVSLCLAMLYFPSPTPEVNFYSKEYTKRFLWHIYRFLLREMMLTVLIEYIPICFIIFIIKFVYY